MEKIVIALLVMAVGMVNPVFAAEPDGDDHNVVTAKQELAANNEQISPATTQDNKLQVEQHEATAGIAKLNINTANVKELSNIKGMNVARAKMIVRYRNHHGLFKDVQELRKLRAFTKLSDEQFATLVANLTTS